MTFEQWETVARRRVGDYQVTIAHDVTRDTWEGRIESLWRHEPNFIFTEPTLEAAKARADALLFDQPDRKGHS